MAFLTSLLWFVIAISVLVTVHEFGHFWVARRLGVKVLRFSVGFGRPLVSRRWGADRTEYVIAAVPLGGYVKMLDEAEGEVPEQDLERAFNRKPLWVRTAVVIAGPLFNFLFAVAAYAAIAMVGSSGLKPVVGAVTDGSLAARARLRAGQQIVAVDGRETRTWDAVIQAVLSRSLDRRAASLEVREADGGTALLSLDLAAVGLDELTRGQFFASLGLEPLRPVVPPKLGEIISGGAAERAGLRAGDRIVSGDGEPIAGWSDWVDFVRARPEIAFPVEVERDGARLSLTLRPEAVLDGDQTVGRIGAAVADPGDLFATYYVTERFGPWNALLRGIDKTFDVSLLTVRMIWRMLTRDVSVENLSGPISIAQYAGMSADIGLTRFVEFLAIVSISLGILNLLPIPLLDGGHLLYYLAELVRGRPLSEEAQFIGQRLGIALLVGLMGLAFYNDLVRVLG